MEPQDTIITIDGSGNVSTQKLQDHGHQILDASTGEFATKALTDAFGRAAMARKGTRRVMQLQAVEALSVPDFEKEHHKFLTSKILGPYVLLIKNLLSSVSKLNANIGSIRADNKRLHDENAALQEALAKLKGDAE